MADLLLLAVVAGLAGTAVFAACCLRLESSLSFILGVFVIAWAAAIAETALLSILDRWTTAGMLVAVAIGAAVAALCWQVVGRPPPPELRRAAASARTALGDPVLAFLVVVSATSFVYLGAVALLVPQIDIDVVGYHLPRAVLWIQQHGVSAIPDAPGSNLVAHPPATEIIAGITMLIAGADRYVGLVQLSTYAIGCLAVTGLATRLGLELRAALYGGLVFATLPIVALQAPTLHNDLAVAVFLTCAAAFALGRTAGELALTALAVALALSTKISGILGLASVALVVLVAAPARRRWRALGAGAVGCLVGSWWFAVNLARTGSWDGGLAVEYGQVPERDFDAVLLRSQQYVLQTFDLAGVVGRDRFLFPIVAVAVAIIGVGLAVARRRARPALIGAGAGALIALAPWFVIGAHDVGVRALSRTWIAVGREEVIGVFPSEPEARPFPGEAWFGAAFVPFLVTAAIIAVRTTDGRRRAGLLTALLGAPTALFVVNASAFVYDGARGRFFVLMGALVAAALGVVLRYRAIAWAGAVVTALTLGLSFVHFHARPMGIELLEPVREETLWSAPRWRAYAAISGMDPRALTTQRTLQGIPSDAVVAFCVGRFWPLYPVLGSGPWRTGTFVGADGRISREATHLIVDRQDCPVPDPSIWERVPSVSPFTLYRRVVAP